MNAKRVATLNARKLKVKSRQLLNWGSVLLFSMLLLVISCSKSDDLVTIINDAPIDNNTPKDENNPPIDDEIPIDNITPITNNDINLMLPQDWVVLNNSYISSLSNVTGMVWDKINGPETYILEYLNWEYTKISSLVEGSYQFELTVNYINESVSKDTVNVNLFDVSIIPQNAKEIIIENVQWTFPWDSALEITDFYNKISRESLFRIFVKRDGSTNWEDVPGWSMSGTQNNSYDYFIERRLPDGAGMYTNGRLYIFYYGSDTSDTPDIKIVYW